ncbi:MAG: hypothetical protein WAM07_15565 [Halobacillus sp.]|uniref:hypothetical protein n=1 Tax=Halobacillus sp. TaxID=56800 RepID=UPI003BAE2294
MKLLSLRMSLFFMLTSWILGFYFISILYTPTIIIPLPNHFLWTDEYKGALGLTTILTILTIPLITYYFKKRKSFVPTRKWSIAFLINLTAWLLTISAQLKIVAYNLGICH